MGKNKPVVQQKRTRKPMGVSSIITTLKKVNSVLDGVATKGTVTSSEKFDLKIAKLYIDALKENIDSILDNSTETTQAEPSSQVEQDDDEDDE